MRRLTKKHEKFNENKTVEEDDDTWPDEFEYYEDATDDPETTTLEQQQQQQRVMVFEYDDFDDGDPYWCISFKINLVNGPYYCSIDITIELPLYVIFFLFL